MPHHCISLPLIQSPLKIICVAYYICLSVVFLWLLSQRFGSLLLLLVNQNDPERLELVCKPLRACVV